MRFTILAVLTIAGTFPTGLSAQATRYTPTYENPTGRELVAVFISSSHCVGNSYPGFLQAVDSLNRSVQRQASLRHLRFVAIGISNDWEPDSGFAYLKSLSTFDEIIVGRNWFNIGFARYVWADSLGKPIVPQVILFERSIEPRQTVIAFSRDSVLARFEGPDKIVDWVKAGTPIP